MTAVPQNEIRILNDRRESSNRLEYLLVGAGALLVVLSVLLAFVLR